MIYIYDLLKTLKIITKNIWRDRRRSFLTISAIAFASFIILVIWGFVSFMIWGMGSMARNWEYGHIQIASPEYFQGRYDTENLISEESEEMIIEHIIEMDNFDYYNQRYYVPCILQNGQYSVNATAVFGMPDAEMLMTPFISQGEILSFYPANELILGESMSEHLNVEIGGSIQITIPMDNNIYTSAMSCHALYNNPVFEDNQIVFSNIDYLPEITGQSQPNVIIIYLRDTNSLEQVQTELTELLANTGLEVKNHEELSVFYRQAGDMFETGVAVFLVVLVFVLFFNINNSVNMIIMDREKEIGTLRSIGTSRIEIVRNIVLELFFVGIIGSALGWIGAELVKMVTSAGQFYLPPAPGQSDVTPIMVKFSFQQGLLIFTIFACFAAISSVFPAIRASRMNIANSLRNG